MARHPVGRRRSRLLERDPHVLRIIGGRWGGRRIAGPKGTATRPTAERVREGIASALDARGWIEGAVVLDVFAGTGALALEALSRGAARAVCVDRDPALVRAIRDAARTLGAEVEVVGVDVTRPGWIERVPPGVFDLAFFDPPYDRIALVGELLTALREADRLAPGAAIVVEHARKSPPIVPSGFREVGSYRYGDTAVLLLTHETP